MNTRILGPCVTVLFFVLALASPLRAAEKSESRIAGPLKGLGQEVADWEARWELARLLSYVKRYGESLAQYDKLLKEKPGLTKARLEMARVLYWDGQREKAAQELSAIPSEQMEPGDRIVLADIYVSQKEYDQAEPIYRAHLKGNPEDDQVRLKLAEVLSWTGRHAESLSLYEKLLAKRPDDLQLRRKYGMVLMWAGRNDEAIKELRRSLGE